MSTSLLPPSVSAPSPSARLLRALRAAMAGAAPDRERMGQITRIIAGNMDAQVCSIYLRQPDGRLALCATHGLNPHAIGRTVLAPGEGLIGEIAGHARPLNLAQARAHPAFSYRSETGEEAYQSFLGVPILRNGRVSGVLAVQTRAPRNYHEDEVETLQTVAMVVAELAARGSLAPAPAPAPPPGQPRPPRNPHRRRGSGWAEGIALGHLVLHQPRIEIEQLIAEDPAVEHERLDRAIYGLRGDLDRMISARHVPKAGETREILETYRMLADDRSWLTRMHDAVDSGLTAEAAIERVQDSLRARFHHQTNPYLRERLYDLDDLAHRLIRQLTGAASSAAAGDLPKDTILAARNMGPAELLDYARSNLRGVILEEGGREAHVTIVARALAIPLIGRLPGFLDIAQPGDAVILDAQEGQVYLNPETSLISAYAEKVRFRARARAHYRARAGQPAVTRDGQEISLLMTAGLLIDLPHLAESGADGIGLFRTELQFMIAATMPRLAAQTELYRRILQAAGDKPVVFRTLDIGGDKILPYMDRLAVGAGKEENPALGWRAIRIGLDRPALLRYQLRALLAAAPGRALQIMFPMVSEISEFTAARRLLARETARARHLRQTLPRSIETGVMLEVPSLFWQLDGLLPEIDFLSVGSNDLFQFLYASDRSNPRLSERYDPLGLAGLRLLRDVRRACDQHQTPLTLCGEIASHPLEALALIGLGFRRIAMPPTAIGPVKDAIRAVDAARLTRLMEKLCADPAADIRARLTEFAHAGNLLSSPEEPEGRA